MDRGGTNPFADLLLMWRLRKVYKETRPDIVLHYTLKPVVFGSIVARLLKIPNVAIVTGQGSCQVNGSRPFGSVKTPDSFW